MHNNTLSAVDNFDYSNLFLIKIFERILNLTSNAWRDNFLIKFEYNAN